MLSVQPHKEISYLKNALLRAVPVYQKHLGRAGAWNIFWNNFEEYPTTNETDFMGSVTMSPASGRQKYRLY